MGEAKSRDFIDNEGHFFYHVFGIDGSPDGVKR